MTNEIHYDLCVIGGGINGAGIARDAAGRGLSVLLVEAQDLAGATSSVSTKLVGGRVRDIEKCNISAIYKSLKEMDVLYRNAQHIITPVDCVLYSNSGNKHKCGLRRGLWLYKFLAKRRAFGKILGDSTNANIEDYACPLKGGSEVIKPCVYRDCWVDDTRLVVVNAVDAAMRGAKILIYTSCDKLEQKDGCWLVSLRDTRNNDMIDVSASMVVNATGPWVGQFLYSVGIGENDPDLPKFNLVKGSHIILARKYDGDQVYVLQQPDGRAVFVAPYENEYTIVGSTHEEYEGNDPRNVRILDKEIGYLLAAYNAAFAKPITGDDVVFAFSGVKPSFENGNNGEEGYVIYHHKRRELPLISVYGDKLANYRLIAQDVVDKLMDLSGRISGAWSAGKPLVGGEFAQEMSFARFVRKKQQEYPWLPEGLLMRYAKAYGSRMDYFLLGAEGISGLGQYYGDGVYEAEVNYLRSYEWAYSMDDIIWRRSKIGLFVSDETLVNIGNAF